MGNICVCGVVEVLCFIVQFLLINKLRIRFINELFRQLRGLCYISVLGCPDMSPPNGAWTTRDGDIMEIGCHSGAKSWTLTCVENQWIGAVGYCGTGNKKVVGTTIFVLIFKLLILS